MAQREPRDEEDDTLDLTEDMELRGPDDESEEGGEGEEERDQPDDEGEEPEDEGEGAPAFDEDESGEEEGENATIRRMRERLKELDRENAELRRQTPPPEMELGPKPTLDDCDYDEAEFGEQLEAWNERKRKIGEARKRQSEQAEVAQREWESDLQTYERQRDELKLPDFETAADVIKATLTLAQQAVIVKAASRPAAFVYALAKSDARLNELAKISDPIKFAAAIARMEGGIKVVKKRRAPAPDRPATGTGRMPGTTDKHLEKLEAEAERTGNRTELIAYRKKLAKRGK